MKNSYYYEAARAVIPFMLNRFEQHNYNGVVEYSRTERKERSVSLSGRTSGTVSAGIFRNPDNG